MCGRNRVSQESPLPTLCGFDPHRGQSFKGTPRSRAVRQYGEELGSTLLVEGEENKGSPFSLSSFALPS